jgi:hypothetical protein
MMKLFASFTGLLREIKSGNITPQDLEEGFFAFGCTRDHAFNPQNDFNEVEKIFDRDPAAGAEAHRRIKDALLAAEVTHRVFWAKDVCPENALAKPASLPYYVLEILCRVASMSGTEIIR